MEYRTNEIENGYYISRFTEGCTLNEKEYLLTEKGESVMFKSIQDAVCFLLEQGFKNEEIGYSVFIESNCFDNSNYYTPNVPAGKYLH